MGGSRVRTGCDLSGLLSEDAACEPVRDDVPGLATEGERVAADARKSLRSARSRRLCSAPMTTLGRRAFMLGALASLAAACTRGGANAPLYEDAERQLAELERKVGGRVGVLAVDTGSGARIARRSSERFAMCSTFKIVLVAALLSRVERGELSLDERVPFSAADLVEHAPVTTAHVAEGAMSLGDLCDAAVEVSDNTATNLLLPKVGGPAGLTSYARGLGEP